VQDVEVRGHDSARGRPVPTTEVPLDESGFADFSVAGARVSGEFRCTDCGYGAVVHRTLPPCPMCHGTVWESRGAVEPQSAA